MTTFSPYSEGIVDTRMSTAWFLCRSLMRPSWGSRCSLMSMLPRILMREMTAARASAGTNSEVCSRPSTRKRTFMPCSIGSRWMSLARRATPCWMMLSTRSGAGRILGRVLRTGSSSGLGTSCSGVFSRRGAVIWDGRV